MVVTVGFFDGVHMGHRRVLKSLLEKGDDAAVVTFWPHPRVVLQKDLQEFALLNTIEEKTANMRGIGIRDIRCLDFTRELASMTAEQFVGEYLIDGLGCRSLVLGYDNRLGSDGLDTVDLAHLGRSMGLDVDIVPHYEVDSMTVSSTRIRNSLADGDVALAARMLGYRYCLKGVVLAGSGLGRSIGFPMAEMAPSYPLKAVPGAGVYAVEVIIQGKSYRGMTLIGEDRTIQTNIFDFDRDICSMEIELRFISKVRHEQRFDSLEQLADRLLIDTHRCYGCN